MLIPMHDRVLVEVDESLPNQAGLLLKPVMTKWREADDQIGNRGKVVAVGPGKRNKHGCHIPLDVKPGDYVRFSELEFPEDFADGKRYALIQEADITFVETQVH